MNVSSTAMMMVVAVCVVGVAILSGGSVGTDGRMSRFARAESGDMEIAALVETVERKQSGKTAVTLSLCAGMKVAGKGMVYELTDEKTLLYLKDTSCVGDMLPGDTLMARVRVKKVENFAEGFDYVGYMAKKNIYFICFQEGNCSILHCERPEFRFRILRARRVWIAAMRRRLSPLKTVNEALVLAFLTGEKELVDDDTLKDFRRSGMMHTLALSGLHVGIIYSLLSFVFSVIGNYPTSKKLRSAIVILCLWPYALLTGLGTSICRAVIMASVYELAVILERERAPLNALAASAIIITLVDPSAPSTISFQLSFGAMLGISIFYRPLSAMVSEREVHPQMRGLQSIIKEERLPWHPDIPEGKWVKGYNAGAVAVRDGALVKALKKVALRLRGKIWDLCSLSIACQIITAPLIWVAFGSFPCWSLLANILCGPLVAVSMMLAPVCITVRSVPFAGGWTFCCLDTVLDALRFCVGVMGTL